MTAITYSSHDERIYYPSKQYAWFFLSTNLKSKQPFATAIYSTTKTGNTHFTWQHIVNRWINTTETKLGFSYLFQCFSGQSQALRLNKNPKRHQQFSSKQQRTQYSSTARTRNLNRLNTFFKLWLKCNLKEQKQWKKPFSFTSPEWTTTNI